MEEYKIRVKLSADDYKDFFYSTLFYKKGFLLLIFLATLSPLLFYIFSTNGSVILSLVMLVIILTSIVFGINLKIKNNFEMNKLAQYECLYIINDDGVNINSEISNSKITWNLLYKFIEYKKFIALFATPNFAYIIPKRCLQNQNEEIKLMKLLQSKEKQINNTTKEDLVEDNSATMIDNSTVKKFVVNYILNFKSFAKSELIKKNPSFFPLVLYLDGVARTLDRISRPSNFEDFHSWSIVWAAALVGGLLGALSIYYIYGSIYHFVVMLAGGKKDITISRNIATYSILPMSLALILGELLANILYGNAYFNKNFSVGFLGIIYFIFYIVITAISVRLGYIALREVQETKKIPTILLFVICPSILYFVAFFILPLM